MSINRGQISVFGAVAEKPVHQVTIRSQAGAVAKILTWGAVIQELSIPLKDQSPQNVVLGYTDFAAYEANAAYFGALVGRFANRIANGQFRIDGKTFNLDQNENQKTTLHGGKGGFSQVIWEIAALSESAVTLTLFSVDGDQGFPGNLRVKCKYTLSGSHDLNIDLWAETDQPTPVNLAQHSYFNLDGAKDVSSHQLQIFADHYTPVSSELIPTGEIRSVVGSAFDFRIPRQLNEQNFQYDHNFVLRREQSPTGSKRAAQLTSLRNGMSLNVWTTKPGLHFYDGHAIAHDSPSHHNSLYGNRAGICLETQFFPDAPNQTAFASAILMPKEIYHHTSRFTFSQN